MKTYLRTGEISRAYVFALADIRAETGTGKMYKRIYITPNVRTLITRLFNLKQDLIPIDDTAF